MKTPLLLLAATLAAPLASVGQSYPKAGGPPLESSTWVLFLGPAGSARDIVNRLAAETRKAINESDIKERFNQIGIIAKWAKVITTAGVKAEQ